MSDVYKPIVNSLSDWSTYTEYGDIRLRGKTLIDQRLCSAGEYIITSPLQRIYVKDGVRFGETRNSRYILAEGV